MSDLRLDALRAVLGPDVDEDTARRALAAADAAMWRSDPSPPYGTAWALGETPCGVERVLWNSFSEAWHDQRGHPVSVIRWALTPQPAPLTIADAFG